MRGINMHEAKTHLPRSVGEAARGEAFVTAEAGKPLVKVAPLGPGERAEVRRLGLLRDADWKAPEDFDTMDQEEIIRLFGGED